MVNQKKVKSLFELATTATYRYVVSKIEYQLQAPPTTEIDVGANTRPPKKKRKLDPSDLKKKDSPNIVKAQLDEYLVSWYSHLKHQLVQRFIHNYCDDEGTARSNMQLNLAFIDSVLDQSFTRFHLAAIKKDNLFLNVDPAELLNIIIKRSPLLQSLDLTLRSPQGLSPTMDQQFGHLLGKLT